MRRLEQSRSVTDREQTDSPTVLRAAQEDTGYDFWAV